MWWCMTTSWMCANSLGTVKKCILLCKSVNYVYMNFFCLLQCFISLFLCFHFSLLLSGQIQDIRPEATTQVLVWKKYQGMCHVCRSIHVELTSQTKEDSWVLHSLIHVHHIFCWSCQLEDLHLRICRKLETL